MKKILLIIFLLPFLGFSQVTGDYRSLATGSWTSPSSWQYYNGSSWVAATTYPGQTTGTGTVTIRDSHVITISNNTPNNFTSLVIGTGNSGKLIIAADVNVKTSSVIINQNSIMTFGQNNQITFPENTSIVIYAPGKLDTDTNCSNNNAIYLGSVKYSVCTGGGNASTTFAQLNERGGTGSATSNTPVCTGSQLVLTAIPPVATSGSYTYTYRWSGNGISSPAYSNNATYTINNVNVNNHGGGYTVDIRRNDGIVSTVSTNVVINPTPKGEVYYYTSNPICYNSMTANLTTNNVAGNILGWEKKLDSGSYSAIPNTAGLTTFSEVLSTAGVWTYRLVLGSGACPTVYSSNTASVTVVPPLTISLVSNNSSACQNTHTSTLSYTATTGNASGVKIDFNAAANSAGIQDLDQRVTNGGGAGTLNIQYNSGTVPTGTYNGILTVVSDNPSCTSSTTYPVTLTINSGSASISTQPSNRAVCLGTNTSFSVVASGGTSYQWQVSINGGTSYSNLSNVGVYSSVTTATMNITGATAGMDNYRYRAVVGGCAGSITSNAGILTISSAPTTAAAGVDQSKCNVSTFTLAGNAPTVGTGVWSLVSGTATITTPTSNVSGVTGVPAGTSATLRWTISNGTCTASTDDVILINDATLTASISYSGSPYCKSITAVQSVTQTGTSGGTYTVFPAGLTISTSTGEITPSTSTAGTYVVTYTYGSGSCTGLTATTSVTISDLTVAPTVGVITQPTCLTTTGSVVLNGLPNSWLLTRIPGNITTTGTGNSTTISGLATGTYTYTVTDLSKGLKAEYFNNTDLSGTPALIRTDATVNFDFGNGSPAPSISADNFSARWSGFVQPLYSETYTFRTNSDDGIRLWVNGVQVINNWTDHGPIIDQSTPIALTAGTKYKIVLEYYERGGGAVAQLSWSSANQTLQAIPQTQLDPPSSCTSTASANVVINPVPAPPTSPVVGTVTQPTCATATGSVVLNSLPAGSWMLTRAPGNIKTAGTGASTTISGLSTGTYTYTVNNLINGLKAEYFNNTDLSGTPALIRTDATVGFDFGNGSPDPSIGADNFSARWSGFVQPLYSETYTFRTNSDDGIRLWVNGVQVINNWTDHGPTVNQSTAIALTAGTKYEIVLEYYERGGGAVSQLSWSSANQALQIIPQSQLFSVGVGDCSSVASANVVINAQPGIPSAPIVGTRTQPNCSVLTGSVNLSGLPATGTWTITAAPATPGLTGLSGTGSEATVSGLTANTTYAFTVTVVGGCTSVPSSNVVINANPSTLVTWNGTSWSSTPTTSTRVEFIGGVYNSSTNLHPNVDACSCYVKNNAEVTFEGGHTLNVINEVQVLSGSLTFENNASLVQVTDAAVNSGSITYKRVTSPVNRYDFTYWSSPVAAMTLGLPVVGLSPTTFYDKYFIYNNAWVSVPRSTVMLKGEGYSVRAPQTTAISGNPLPFLATFTGEPHNGEVKKTLTGNGVYLIGNPYPSAIDADKFLEENEDVLQGTLYFWTHNSPPSSAVAGDKKYNYTTADYATYNRTGGVLTNPSTIPFDGKIASAQGFFAPASAAGGELVFNNVMRLSDTGAVLDNSQFFKLSTNSKTAKTTTANIEKNRIWLNLTNSEGAFKQTLIGYVTGATNNYDGAFDGVTYDGNQYVDFYSVNNEVNLSIQGRALPFVKKDSVVLGYKSTIKGDFKISIDQIDGSLTTQNIFLEDKDLKVLHDLKKEAYTFITDKGVFNNRFVLRYTDKNAIDEVIVPEVPGKDSNAAVIVSVKNGEIKINATATKLDKVIVYDMAGRRLFQKNKVDANVFFVPPFVWNHQALVVDIVLTDGTKHSRKIIN